MEPLPLILMGSLHWTFSKLHSIFHKKSNDFWNFKAFETCAEDSLSKWIMLEHIYYWHLLAEGPTMCSILTRIISKCNSIFIILIFHISFTDSPVNVTEIQDSHTERHDDHMEQQVESTQDATTIVTLDYNTDFGSDWEFLDAWDITGVRQKIKASNKTASFPPTFWTIQWLRTALSGYTSQKLQILREKTC